jgi:F-box/leucine-rich repeat protein 10/11
MSAQHYRDLGENLALQTQTPPDEAPKRLQTVSDLYLEPKSTKVKENERQNFDSQKARLDTNVTVATTSEPSHHAKLQDVQKVNVTGEIATTMPNSPQSLAAEPNETTHANISPHIEQQTDPQHESQVNDRLPDSPKRPSSTSNIPITGLGPEQQDGTRARSVPLQNQINVQVSAVQRVSNSTSQAQINPIDEGTKCAGCDISPNSFSGEFVDWLQCNGCKQWFHLACAGFTTREVRKIDKFYCLACQPKYGKTTFVRKSSRAHTSIDYAGLNEGVWRTSDETVEHHYIKPIKEGSIKILPESFPRMTPEEVTAEFFEKCSNLGEPIVIPGYLNPRSTVPTKSANHSSSQADGDDIDSPLIAEVAEYSPYEQEMVTNNGQDRLDMVIPQGLTVRQVADLYGADMPIEVIDVKSQEGDSSKKWTVGKWADYYEATGEKVIRNVISLEVSKSLLGRLIRRPKAVRDLDLQDAVWPSSDERRTSVGFYCLMSVADSYTDFHIDFAGSSVYYHILKGKKTFFFIPPTNKNLKKYEEWCLNKAMNSIWLPDLTKECYRVDLSPGDTMLIPSGWIHSVWTPEDSLVIGGNFLTRLHYSMQLRVVEIERTCRVPLKYRYPFFQKVMWYAMIKYLEQDPLPESVRMLFYSGNKFERKTPVYLEMSKFGPNSDAGEENYHARYYSKQELNGLPDLISYIFRTLMIYLDRLEGITQESRKAVTRSIPKGKGDPLELARTFALWVAWKRGNEDIPLWAHPNGLPSNKENSLSTNNEDGALENKPEPVKKISVAEMKKLERTLPVKGYQPPQYPTAMQTSVIPDGSADEDSQMTDLSLTNTPKTSVLGPKRTACDICRKRKMRCKHIPDSPPGMRTAVGVVIDKQPNTKVRTMLAPASNGAGVMVAGVMLSPEHIGRQRDPGMIVDQTIGMDGKKGRNKACPECRRSKVENFNSLLKILVLTISDRGVAFMMRMATSIQSSRTNLLFREALAAKSASLLAATTQTAA